MLGLAGLLPYLATSFSTLALAKEINTAHEFGTGYLMNAQTAEQFLHLLEPIQVGYGAVVGYTYLTHRLHIANVESDHLVSRRNPLGL